MDRVCEQCESATVIYFIIRKVHFIGSVKIINQHDNWTTPWFIRCQDLPQGTHGKTIITGSLLLKQ